MLMTKERAYRMLQSEYDAAPGLTEKMRIKWQVLNAKALYTKQKQMLEYSEGAKKVAKRKLEDISVEECVERQKEAAAASKKAGAPQDDNIVEYPYPSPLV